MRYLFISMMMVVMMAMTARGQIREDFSDEELTQNPPWTGELEKFKFSSSSAVPVEMRPALQLNGEGEGTATLCLQQELFPDMQWEFWIKLSFNSSSSNFARVYLSSASTDLADTSKAWFLQAGGAVDSVWFGTKGPEGESLLKVLPVLFTGNSTNAFRVKVIKEHGGNWNFYGDPAGGFTWTELGSLVVDDTVTGGYFALHCRYTSSNASKFYFDDIYCGPKVVDSTGPTIVKVRISPPSDVRIDFDEGVEEVSASSVMNYTLEETGVHPYEAFRLLDPSAVMIFFEEDFEEGRTYGLRIEGVQDLSGNMMELATEEISWYVPKPYDVVINEIMADPSPPVMMPEYEYVELYNRTALELDLSGWDLEISGSSHVLREVVMDPKGYLLLMPEEALPVFKFCGPAFGFSSFTIPNSGADMVLHDSAGSVMCHSYYSPEKFTEDDKADGGWSLERIDPERPCMDDEGWRGSSDPSGGTPGRENAVFSVLELQPRIERICCLDSVNVEVGFNQSWQEGSLVDPTLYLVDKGIGNPLQVLPLGDAMDDVVLTLPWPLSVGQIYRLEISAGMNNCTGVPPENPLSAEFALPSPAEPFDAIFNEILFQPLGDGAEYIELYNRSQKTLHLDEIRLAFIREVPPNPPDTELYMISQHCCPLFPGGYLVLTKDPAKVMQQFRVEDPATLLRTDPFPSLNNDGGRLLLLDGQGHTIDGLDYSQEMQYPLLNSFAGVALERIYPDVPGTGPGNWHSASSESGFGTPGYRNSQYLDRIAAESVLEVSPPVFTPNGDGQDDVLGICCKFDEAGMLITITIFSKEGRLARRLIHTALAGTENHFSWDGLTDDRVPAPDGIYIVLLECMSMEGYSQKYKKAAVLVAH